MKPKTLLEQKAIEYFNEDEEFHSMPCFEAGWRACREELANRLYSLMVWPKDSSRSEIIRAFGDQPAPDNVLFFEKKEIELSQKTKEDPGAVNKQKNKENLIAIEFRDLVCKELDKKGLKYIKDENDEKLSDYLKRIKTGSGSVVIEFHCDSAASSSVSGREARSI